MASNPLTFSKLVETLLFQVGLLGIGVTVLALYVVPRLNRFETKAMLQQTKMKRALRLLPAFMFKGAWFILLIGTLGILLTDIGWPEAIQTYGLPTALLFARASGAPNGAHLLSYIPLPFLGLYVAWRYRKDVLLDCFQGILVVAFGVAVHEGIWLIVYWIQYAQFWNLGVLTNIMEDVGFSAMCVLFVLAFWKYPYRTIPLKTFRWPIVGYSAFMAWWYTQGVPVTTINNWQLGTGIYEVTKWWSDPWVNGIEIASWVFVAVTFFLAIRYERPAS